MLTMMKSRIQNSQWIIIVIGLIFTSLCAFLYLVRLVELPALSLLQPKTSPSPTPSDLPVVVENIPQPSKEPFEIVPDIPGLYESLIAKGLEPSAAAVEYCKHIWIQYFCETKVLRAKQFASYTNDYALDDKYVYIGRRSGGAGVIYHKFSWLDKDTFQYLGLGYFKDKNGFYYNDYEGGLPYPTKIITNVDVETAELIRNKGTSLIKDKNHVYTGLPYLEESEYISLDILENADPSTLMVSIKEGEDLEDKNNYYTDKLSGFTITPKNK